MDTRLVDAQTFVYMIRSGADELNQHAQEVNDLNVFPIPDGDTGDNMTMTISGGATAHCSLEDGIGKTSMDLANAMLLSARGNSGVILSQFFAGIADGLTGLTEASVDDFKNACRQGVNRAYSAVVTPTEGTILTVAKEATEYACTKECKNVEEFLCFFLEEAYRSLARTPELLNVLKEAGVVDSGAAGLVYIVEGMYQSLTGKKAVDTFSIENRAAAPSMVNVDMFTSDMQLEFGYCTELLIRLQNSKTDVDNFDVSVIIDYLTQIGGDSIVCFKTDSIVKLHVHTMTPDKVLAFCQQFGEFLTLKIENMMIQHNEAGNERPESAAGSFEKKEEPKKRTKFGVVAVASGDGIVNSFRDFGAYVIKGGQTMNPSTADFVRAFDEVNAECIFVLPNNGNVIMAAKQAASIYEEANIRVIPTKTIGDGFSVLSMMSFDSADPEEIERQMLEAFEDVTTIEISKAIRNAISGEQRIREGEYLAICGKDILNTDEEAVSAAVGAMNQQDLSERYLVMVIRGVNGTEEGSKEIADAVRRKNSMVEVCEAYGGQDIYDYYLVLE